MLKSICCSICLSMNKRTINIYQTELQYVYENLANFKISDTECWMCYICHTRLRQCHQLQQLSVHTRGLVGDFLQKKIDIKVGVFKPLLHLSTSKTKVTNRTYNSSCIKQESDTQMELNDSGTKHQAVVDGSNLFEVEVAGFPLSVESEDPLVDAVQASANMAYDEIQESKVLEVKIVKRSRSADGQYFLPVSEGGDDGGEHTWSSEGGGNVEVKLELEEITEKGMSQMDEHGSINVFMGRDSSSDAQADDKKPHSCYVCFKRFKFQSDLRRHVSIHSNEKPFRCDICSRRYKTLECLHRHMRVHINYLPFTCEVCGKKFLFESDLQRHVRSHKDEEANNVLSPAICLEKEALSQDGLVGDETTVCRICLKKVSNKGSLTRHMRIHTGEKPFVCHVCAKKFIEKCALDNHLLTHTGVKRFSCDICAKKFTLKLNLQRHRVIHTTKKPITCNICFKEFRFKATLKAHRRIHADVIRKPDTRRFSCEICSEKFSSERFLNSHVRIHSSDKVFSCDVCSKKFLRKKDVNRHKQSHTGDQPYSCDICSKKFTQRGSLKVHKQSHTGVRKFTCHICSKKFFRNSTLQAHIKIHDGRPPPVPVAERELEAAEQQLAV